MEPNAWQRVEPADDDALALYDKLEQVVLPLYYDDRPAWTKVMKGAISKRTRRISTRTA